MDFSQKHSVREKDPGKNSSQAHASVSETIILPLWAFVWGQGFGTPGI